MKYFLLFQSCIPVKGAKRCTICDLAKKDIYFISLGLYEFLTEFENVPYHEILDFQDEEVRDKIKSEVDFLVEKEVGFFTSNPKKFPRLKLDWAYPAVISNAIIEHNNSSDYNILDVIQQLNQQGCKFIEIRFYDGYSLESLEAILKQLDSTDVNSLIIYLKYSAKWNRKNLLRLLILFPRIAHLHVFGTQDLKLNENEEAIQRISFHKGLIHDNSCCGTIKENYFSINFQSFSEAQEYNSCLNGKMTISATGNIKNCPSLPETYGNVKKVAIKNSISDNFRKYWKINKDQIDICRDCEFRYLCPDCRAFLKDAENPFSKPKKCNYNPYTAVWE
ncbi:grasp-with-spasm system SPASM domain peptide maturase [Flagellimonas meridianipacifica]|uniref:SPASM domain peptide maturase of grasp-with-spasm system n=1 Tax=Flagellimonas meridianipacifica TaxID=1080225 RepID=A0A2T0MCP1_9FLAO|nr:grasp-with-spasm system SPASM domain peptide maturase [Allomuricauda pacifica]PRX55261.1 SPASM domain peptide maturase of grasp-with-spasm system [Allomuricauda pacifica]